MIQEMKITIEPVGIEDLNRKSIILHVDNDQEEHYLKIKFLNDIKEYVEYSENLVVLDSNINRLIINYKQEVPDII